jgi:ribA/ribD-fused uncharacterized protein
MEHGDPIRQFRGEYRWLSSLWLVPVPYMEYVFRSAEHAYVAAKTEDEADIQTILTIQSPRDAKRYGRTLTLVKDWDTVKYVAMLEIVHSKFNHNPLLAEKLLETGDKWLIEGNTWHDQVWGDCNCRRHRDIPGDNALGHTLMRVREELRA